jgi:hypothetical protein
MVTSRYEVALHYKNHWPLLSRKGDEHTNGIYFDEKYGYLIERIYAVRIKHNEPVSPVFYTPSFEEDGEDEVIIDFPFINMTKRPNKYNFLFQTEQLERKDLSYLFHQNTSFFAEMPIEPLKRLLQTVAKKRERDRSWLVLKRSELYTKATIIRKEKEGYESLQKMEIENQCHEKQEILTIYINANTLLHALNLFSSVSTVSFFQTHDKIKLTSEESTPKVEALISTPKESIKREIDLSF